MDFCRAIVSAFSSLQIFKLLIIYWFKFIYFSNIFYRMELACNLYIGVCVFYKHARFIEFLSDFFTMKFFQHVNTFNFQRLIVVAQGPAPRRASAAQSQNSTSLVRSSTPTTSGSPPLCSIS